MKPHKKIIWDSKIPNSPYHKVSYVVMLCPSLDKHRLELNRLSKLLNPAYDKIPNGPVCQDGDGLWRIPHVTCIIFKAELQDFDLIEQKLYDYIYSSGFMDAGSMEFAPKSYQFFVEWLVSFPDSAFADKIKKMNKLLYRFIRSNFPQAMVTKYEVPLNKIPHLSLNTLAPASNHELILDAATKALKDYRLTLDQIIIGALVP